MISPSLREGGVHREQSVREEEAGRCQPGSQELSELTASWPGPAVEASPGLRFLRGWAGGLTEPSWGGVRGASGAGELLVLTKPPPRSPGVACLLRAMDNVLQPV